MCNNHGILDTYLKSIILFADNYHWPHCDHTETATCIHGQIDHKSLVIGWYAAVLQWSVDLLDHSTQKVLCPVVNQTQLAT